MNKKKKKLAFLIGGQLRTFENAHKTWTFLNEIEHDIFFSTWDTSYDKDYPTIINDVKDEDILQYFPDAKISIVSDNLYTSNVQKLNYHWKTLFKMVDDSEFLYDNVLLTRPDIFLIEHSSFSKFINNISEEYIFGLNSIYIPKPPFDIFVQDILFLGKYEIMKSIFSTLDLPEKIENNMHYYIAKHLVANDIYVEDIHDTIKILDWSILRLYDENK